MKLEKEMFQPIGSDKDLSESMFTPSINYWQDAWRRLKKNRVAIACMIFICVLTVCAIVMPMISPFILRTSN